jgi:excisionase family DNA binding protein
VKPLVTQDEFAKLLRCSTQTIRRLRLAGEIAYLPGRPVKFRQEDIDRWLARNAGRRIGWAAKREPKLPPTYGRPTTLAEAERLGRQLSALVRARRPTR